MTKCEITYRKSGHDFLCSCILINIVLFYIHVYEIYVDLKLKSRSSVQQVHKKSASYVIADPWKCWKGIFQGTFIKLKITVSPNISRFTVFTGEFLAQVVCIVWCFFIGNRFLQLWCYRFIGFVLVKIWCTYATYVFVRLESCSCFDVCISLISVFEDISFDLCTFEVAGLPDVLLVKQKIFCEKAK